jgi:hypothetical protein
MHNAIRARRQILVRIERISASLEGLMVRSEFIGARLAIRQLMREFHAMSRLGIQNQFFEKCHSRADRRNRNGPRGIG